MVFADHDFKNFPELTDGQMIFYYFQSPHEQLTHNFFAIVTSVHDGDTITVETEGRDFKFPIRLARIDAPEMKDRGGEESRDWLRERILNKKVEVRINPRNRVEKFGRLLGDIIIDGISMSEESVRSGRAVWFGLEEGNKTMNWHKVMQKEKLKLENNIWLG